MEKKLFFDNLVTKAVEKLELVDGKQQAVFTEEELEDIDAECLTLLLKAAQTTNSFEGDLASVKFGNKTVKIIFNEKFRELAESSKREPTGEWKNIKVSDLL